jgi:hypothetical protein
MSVVETLVPYVVSTHVKDMGVEEYKDGFLLSEVPLGRGFLDLQKMFELCLKSNPNVRFSLEMITRDPLQIPCFTDDYWKVFPSGKATDLAKAIRMVKANGVKELPRVNQLNFESKLNIEEQNILACLDYSKTKLEK